MTFNRMATVPLPLALHLASYAVLGLFCLFGGLLNLLDPGKILPNAVPFFLVMGFSWGYVFGILMARREVVALGFFASVVFVGAGVWKFAVDWRLGALLLAIGVYGLVTLVYYRKQILEA